ncbi:DNA (cytosine-5-)-methyltransferase [Mesobacillus boroniphilus]|uniref:Cytosine-specific methyltransferase n=1 Tax=Mesobacillus boroniphilus TaxID=308892 RepID=A0A944GWN7_9BACI|nr:DNA (cytosine-5-)-methyltransferase [Mesobacillus boroniphilus]MBS8263845.1 DNA (cytosine-5-)-methyltransferase [Mesobacillus boroniphilus]
MFKFIDLFAGIGGIRLAFQELGGECVFSSEWDSKAQDVYEKNFGERPYGDITKIHEKDIPDHDILLAGFPCQPFSLAGVSKKNALGVKHGFEDETQGTLFFDIKRIIKEKRPKAFLLENVKNLKSHDNGKTFKVIMRTLERELGYRVYTKVIDAKGVLPQHRERIYIVGFKKNIEFQFPTLPTKGPVLNDILEKEVEEKYTLSDKLWNYLQSYAQKHKEKGNGFGFGLADPSSYSRTLSARYYKDGSEILISQGENKNPRRLTPRECAKLQGFPDSFKIADSDWAAYKQLGNSVAVPVVKKIAQKMLHALKEERHNPNYYRGLLVDENYLNEVINRIDFYKDFYIKIISSDDFKASLTRSGSITISNDAWHLFFQTPGIIGESKEKCIKIYWEQLEELTHSKVKWNGNKKNLNYKLTHIGKNIPYFSEEYCGDIVVLIKVNEEEFIGYTVKGENLFTLLNQNSVLPNNSESKELMVSNLRH